MMNQKNNIGLVISVALTTAILLAMVQWKVDRPMLLLERFVPNGGWMEIPVIVAYSALLAYLMQDLRYTARLRKLSWTLFSVVFFSQLILGLAGFEKFLMTGKLHLPVPALIVAGPVFRYELGFMPILFLSTIVLSGPAWCSQLCYFGALDNLAAQGRTNKEPIKNRKAIKLSILGMVVLTAFLSRVIGAGNLLTTLLASAFGVIGLIIILILSRRQKRMMHCITWCPIGTIVNYGRYINPFRMYIDDACTLCMACSGSCKYDALSVTDINSGKPGATCTYCGDCLPSCHSSSIKYRFPGMSAEGARLLWIGTTVVLHAVFLALARI